MVYYKDGTSLWIYVKWLKISLEVRFFLTPKYCLSALFTFLDLTFKQIYISWNSTYNHCRLSTELKESWPTSTFLLSQNRLNESPWAYAMDRYSLTLSGSFLKETGVIKWLILHLDIFRLPIIWLVSICGQYDDMNIVIWSEM